MTADVLSGMALGALLPTGVACAGAEHIRISALKLDSRAVVAGDLFLAVKGWKADGRQFISQAVANGCAAVVAEADGFAELCPANGTVIASLEKAAIPLILIPNLQSHVSAIAAEFYQQPGKSMEILGVTGTNGKTTCVSLLARIAFELGRVAGQIGTLGWGVVDGSDAGLSDTGMTTPDAIALQDILFRMQQNNVALMAMEVSSHGLEQRRVTAAYIDCAIFTNFSRDHMDFHGSEESYAEAKMRLFSLPSVTQAVVNIDDALGEKIFASLAPEVEAISYGLTADAMVRASHITPLESGVRFHISSPWGEGNVESKLLGEFNVLNLLAAISAYCARGVAFEKVLAIVPKLDPVPGRMQIVTREIVAQEAVDRKTGPSVVVDYSHTPDALKKALMALRQHCRGELVCIFGCGGDRDRGKRPQMGLIAEQLADKVIVTSDNPRSEESQVIIDEILLGMTELKNVRVEIDRREAIELAIAEAGECDCILIAGKGHEQYQQVGDTKLPFSDLAIARIALGNSTARLGGQS